MISIEWYEQQKQAHYMEVLIRHDRERTCWNDRMKYWKEYNAKRN